MYSYYKNIKTELNDCPHTFSADLIPDLSARQYANEQTSCSSPLDRPYFYPVAILCRGGFPLVPGVVLWLVAVVVVVVGEVSG